MIFKDNIQYNIMIFDIDKKNKNFKLLNILQLKWILYIQIQKKCYNLILKIIFQLKMNVQIFIDL